MRRVGHALLASDAVALLSIGVVLICSDALWGPSAHDGTLLRTWLGVSLCIAAAMVLSGVFYAQWLGHLAFGGALVSATLAITLTNRSQFAPLVVLIVGSCGGVLAVAHGVVIMATCLRLAHTDALLSPAAADDSHPMADPLLPSGATAINNFPTNDNPLAANDHPAANDPRSVSVSVEDAAVEAPSAEQDEVEPKARRGFGTLQLLRIARPHRGWLYTGCTVLLVRLPCSLSIPHWVAETIGALSASDYTRANWCVIYLMVLGSADALLDFWCVYLFGVAQQRIIRGLRLDLFGAILRQDISFFDATKSGEITSRLTADCAEMANDLTWVFRFTIEALVRIGGILGYMFYRSWRLGLLALAIVPITALINRFYATFMHHNQQAVQAALAEANSVAQEAIAAIRTVASFAMEGGEHRKYTSRVDVYFRLILRQFVVQGIYFAVCNTFLVNACVQASLLAYGGYLHSRGLCSPHVLLAFMLYQGQLQEYFQNLFNSFTSLLKSSGAAAKVFEYVERRPCYQQGGSVTLDPPPPEATRGSVALGVGLRRQQLPVDGGRGCRVDLTDVWFRYPTRPEAAVLRGLSLEIPSNGCVALVGASGHGKSTVFGLLSHFYEAERGLVAIDGVEVPRIPHAELHAVVAIVSQDPVLMSGSVEANITYGVGSQMVLTDAARDALRERVLASATAANAHGFISELQDQYQTLVGERGVQMSGGQKQRIALARCLMQDPRLLLLDEATSALDRESEKAVQLALDKAMVGRTTLLTAHRLSTVYHAERIAVLHMGRLVEQGSHDELMAKPIPTDGGPSYRRLVGEQVAPSSAD